MIEHAIIFEDEKGNRKPLKIIKYEDIIYKFFKDGDDIILKEIHYED